MTLLTADIPYIDTAPNDAAPSAVANELRRVTSGRRAVLRAALGAGMTIGVYAIGLFPGAGKARAGWYSTYSTWDTCRGYYSASTICYPPTWHISSGVCNGSNYHRDDFVDSTGCKTVDYQVKLYSCDSKNAWKWNGSNTTRCSDGKFKTCGCSDCWWTDSICKHSW